VATRRLAVLCIARDGAIGAGAEVQESAWVEQVLGTGGIMSSSAPLDERLLSLLSLGLPCRRLTGEVLARSREAAPVASRSVSL
jgi:hypothetical protein